MSRHTPGPWEVVGSRICTVANDNKRITLAKTEPGGAFAMSEQQDANAYLIAAAPELLAACRKVIEHRAKEYLDNTIEPYVSLANAIDKTEGR